MFRIPISPSHLKSPSGTGVSSSVSSAVSPAVGAAVASPGMIPPIAARTEKSRSAEIEIRWGMGDSIHKLANISEPDTVEGSIRKLANGGAGSSLRCAVHKKLVMEAGSGSCKTHPR